MASRINSNFEFRLLCTVPCVASLNAARCRTLCGVTCVRKRYSVLPVASRFEFSNADKHSARRTKVSYSLWDVRTRKGTAYCLCVSRFQTCRSLCGATSYGKRCSVLPVALQFLQSPRGTVPLSLQPTGVPKRPRGALYGPWRRGFDSNAALGVGRRLHEVLRTACGLNFRLRNKHSA